MPGKPNAAMKLQILGCAGGIGRQRRLSCYLIDGCLLIDTGAIDVIPIDRPRALLLSHAHLDHVAGYPLLLTSRLSTGCDSLQVHASADTWRRLDHALLCDLVYPDHSELLNLAGRPVARRRTIEGPFETAGYQITPLPMTHAYPCLAFAVQRGRTGLIVGGDTSDSEPIWRFATDHKWVATVTVECSFPDGFEELALRAGHLTPGMLQEQLRGFRRRSVAIHVVHVKPEVQDQVAGELRKRLGRRVKVARDGQTIRLK